MLLPGSLGFRVPLVSALHLTLFRNMPVCAGWRVGAVGFGERGCDLASCSRSHAQLGSLTLQGGRRRRSICCSLVSMICRLECVVDALASALDGVGALPVVAAESTASLAPPTAAPPAGLQSSLRSASMSPKSGMASSSPVAPGRLAALGRICTQGAGRDGKRLLPADVWNPARASARCNFFVYRHNSRTPAVPAPLVVCRDRRPRVHRVHPIATWSVATTVNFVAVRGCASQLPLFSCVDVTCSKTPHKRQLHLPQSPQLPSPQAQRCLPHPAPNFQLLLGCRVGNLG